MPMWKKPGQENTRWGDTISELPSCATTCGMQVSKFGEQGKSWFLSNSKRKKRKDFPNQIKLHSSILTIVRQT